ncbi:hypothetical protein TNCV_3711191 [Trichonephila clavipes]|uniref:Uncharacterized protein n=1 Tax=Trichonephila clavipes TaxID=2585209 RepID=A0A8X6UZG7_TRICX|nr:hypothetical protein TNCV_3711191 [Trichonephila clavipes]
MICLENSPCTTLGPCCLCKLVQSLVEASNWHFRNAFGPTHQSKLRFCYSPHRSVTYSHVTSDLSHGFSGLAFRWSYNPLQCVFAHFLDVDLIAKLLETTDFIGHCLPSRISARHVFTILISWNPLKIEVTVAGSIAFFIIKIAS